MNEIDNFENQKQRKDALYGMLLNEEPVDEGTAEIVNYIFFRLQGVIPSMRYTADSTTTLGAIKREYTFELRAQNINNVDFVNKGINKIRAKGLKFVPTPHEFMTYCQPSPEEIGLPSIEDAFEEAKMQAYPQTWKATWSHAVVKHAYERTGHNQFLNGIAHVTREKFEANYLQACLDFRTGKIMEQLPHQKPLSKFDLKQPETIGKYFFAEPGILDQYKTVSSHEECLAICDNILGKGDSRLKSLIQNLESQYRANGLI